MITSKIHVWRFWIKKEIEHHISNIVSMLIEQLNNASFTSSVDHPVNIRSFLEQTTFEDRNAYEILYTSDLFGMNLDAFNADIYAVSQLLVSLLPQKQNEIFELIISRKRKSDVPYLSEDLLSNLIFTDCTNPIDLLTEKMIGCSARCPFCGAPCKYECINHAGEHVVLQHRPLGVIGKYWFESKQLCTCTCQSAASCDEESGFDVSTLDWHDLSFLPLRSNRQKYSKWNIIPDRNSRTSLYWKWFMFTFHDDLVNHFNVKPGDIPSEWENITWDEAKIV